MVSNPYGGIVRKTKYLSAQASMQTVDMGKIQCNITRMDKPHSKNQGYKQTNLSTQLSKDLKSKPGTWHQVAKGSKHLVSPPPRCAERHI